MIKDLEQSILKNLFSMRSDFLHPYIGVKLRSYQKTIDFIEENLPNATVCHNRNEIFNYALQNLEIEGLILEFGVKSGTTIDILAKKEKFKKKTLYGFDSFEGLPENWSGTKTLKGQLSNEGNLPKNLAKNIKLISGWFKDVLPEFSKNHKEDIAFLHIDCDLYSSTKNIFDILGDRIVAGTVIIFDEFFNYPNWQNHEYKAWQEFVEKRKIKFEYLCYAHTQIGIKIIEK